MQTEEKRESLSSRLGFILLSAGCAIGLGNIWRFPYVCGQGGGGYFVILYLIFLAILGFPCVVMELAIGRASRNTMPNGLATLCKTPSLAPWWKRLGKTIFLGNFVLMMFYVVINGWLFKYAYSFLSGDMLAHESGEISKVFTDMLSSPGTQILYTGIVIAITLAICYSGLQKGVERITKYMMMGLLLLLILCAGHALIQKNATEGLKFFLIPNMDNLTKGFGSTIYTAMTQAFFTLSIGVGSIEIFGSYTDKKKSLSGESILIIVLDTFVAIMAGLIIFPYCYSNNIAPDAGPSLIFITLPKAFQMMRIGNIFGPMFAIFIALAALTTVVAVTENIVAFIMEEFRLTRKKSSILTCSLLFILSIPCILGFNVWSGFTPFGADSSILDLEDFIISNNMLPLGALMMVIFCTHKFGWCIDNFFAEANTGTGLKLAKCTKFYLKWVLPIIIFLVWLLGLIVKFSE